VTTDTDDRLPLPHFTGRLWDELAELHEQRNHGHELDRPTAAAVAGDLITVDRRHRLRGRRSLYAGAGAIAAAVALVAAIGVDQPAEEPPLGTLIVNATRTASDERILHAVTDVVRPVPEFERDTLTNLDHEEWSNWAAPGHDIRVVARNHETGELVAEAGGTFEPDSTTRSIDHVRRTYTDGCWHISGIYGSGEGFAEMVQGELENGHYFEDGTEEIDGEELIVVRIRSEVNDRGEWVGSSRAALYVDPDTYLPRLDRFYDEDGNLEREVTFEYLPRTAENIAKTLPPSAPAGYTEVPNSDICY
jgi:hypothetical protein